MLIDPWIYQHDASKMSIDPYLLGRLVADLLGGPGVAEPLPPGQNKRIIICDHMFKAWKDILVPGTINKTVVWQVCILTSQQPVAPHLFNCFTRLSP